ncbi:amidoligase family protein [Desulfurivibrio sp. D14AmB]|uniref:amidoligase family protein n=1 Tax=Desulfurivibrio sp. D14AmB TaxID=3374370 RepID=UPI00376EFE56
MTTEFRKLPWANGPAGQPRRVGIEIEMAGVDLGTMAEAVQTEFGGRVERLNPFLSRVRVPEFDDFVIELDARVLQDRRYREHLRALGIELDDEDRETLEQWLADAAGILVPHEIVAPPLPLSALPRLDRVRADLQQKGAKGTQSSLLYAFGLQINIEAHSLGAEWLTAILRAFVLLNEALLKAGNIDLTRQLSPYIRPFPGSYIRLILQPDYQPTMARLIDDYLEYNPTRNRPLDMLPLFAEIDRERVWAAPVEHELIKPRPALHYRLPNCEIDDPAWSLAQPFNGWAEVEHLAANRQQLQAAAAQYLQRPAQALGQFTDQWTERIRGWF